MTSYDILTWHLGARVGANDAEEVWSTDGTSTSSVQMRSAQRSDGTSTPSRTMKRNTSRRRVAHLPPWRYGTVNLSAFAFLNKKCFELSQEKHLSSQQCFLKIACLTTWHADVNGVSSLKSPWFRRLALDFPYTLENTLASSSLSDGGSAGKKNCCSSSAFLSTILLETSWNYAVRERYFDGCMSNQVLDIQMLDSVWWLVDECANLASVQKICKFCLSATLPSTHIERHRSMLRP